jgi:hypothetical protein
MGVFSVGSSVWFGAFFREAQHRFSTAGFGSPWHTEFFMGFLVSYLVVEALERGSLSFPRGCGPLPGLA